MYGTHILGGDVDKILPTPVLHPRFFGEQLGSAVGAVDLVRGSGNTLLTAIPLKIRGIDFGNCLASTLGWSPRPRPSEKGPI